MQTVIVDTDIAIDYLRGMEYSRELMLRLWGKDLAYLSILSVYELYAGMKEKEAEDTENYIGACIVEPVTIQIAGKGGEAHRHNRKRGITLTPIDCLIYATAILKGHKILTKNKDHYPDKKILAQP